MKILYILNSTLTLGGATKSFLILLDGIIGKGFSPTVVVPNENGIYKQLRQRGVHTICVSFREATYPWTRNIRDYVLFIPRIIGRIWLNRKAVAELQNKLKGEKIDIIHSNVSVIDIGYRLSRRFHVPHIYHIREFGDLDFNLHYFPSKNHFQKMLTAAESYSVCITQAIQQHHQQASSPTSVVIYNGIHCPVYQRTDIDKKERKYFLFAGRVEPSKGLDILLEAYSRYKGSKPLYIAGDYNIHSDYFKKIKNIIANNGLDDRVLLLGVRNDIEALMQKALALVVPSRFEAFGRSMAEAMFNECLVIGHNTGGTKEQFDNGHRFTSKEIGLRFSNTEELSDRLNEADTMQSSVYEEYIHNALDTVNSLYSTESYIENICKFYYRITNGL